MEEGQGVTKLVLRRRIQKKKEERFCEHCKTQGHLKGELLQNCGIPGLIC